MKQNFRRTVYRIVCKVCVCELSCLPSVYFSQFETFFWLQSVPRKGDIDLDTKNWISLRKKRHMEFCKWSKITNILFQIYLLNYSWQLNVLTKPKNLWLQFKCRSQVTWQYFAIQSRHFVMLKIRLWDVDRLNFVLWFVALSASQHLSWTENCKFRKVQ